MSATLSMREGVRQSLLHAQFPGRCLQHSSSSDFDRLSQELESTLSGIPDPEPRYYRGALLVFCNQAQIGWRMIESAIQKNYCAYEALQSDALLAKSKQTPEFRRLLSEARVCQEKFLSERKQN
jgi:hypothetical protein